MSAPTYVIHSRLHEDQSEVWPDSLTPVTHEVALSMVDMMTEQLRRRFADRMTLEQLSHIREIFNIVKVSPMSRLVDRGDTTPALAACQHLDLDAVWRPDIGDYMVCRDCQAQFDTTGEEL